MKFILVVQHSEGGEAWEEHYDIAAIDSLEKAQAWAQSTIQKFNDTLRPHEKSRKIVSVALAGKSDKHLWHKTNLMTISDPRLGLYDTMKCENCGITGKRFGVSEAVKLDSKFRAKKYRLCPGFRGN